MTLTELRYIVAVAHERHFGRAAEACFVSQPTLSVAIKKLEEELNTQIFERANSEVTMTSLGEQIVSQAQRVLEEANSLKHLAKHGQDPLSGPLRLGAIYTIAPYLLPSLVRVARVQMPNVPLFLEENFTTRLLEMLRQGALDCVVIAAPYASTGLESIELYDEPFLVAVPKGHSWEMRTIIPHRELKEQNTLLLGAGHCFRDHVLGVCPELNRLGSGSTIGEQRSFEGSSLETIRQMVAGGIGISVLPRTSVSDLTASDQLIRYIPLDEPVPTRRVCLVWRKGCRRAPAMEALAKVIRQCDLPGVTFI
ncbi:LysR substrate-binding domain-containing protein [Polynucleobacter antarcticus]|uniref:LysR family transcriptional regulator n=1 Tax=Polynucleobacter antarcticus TaxID=1743162 RepID=A0A6M9PNV3_9BURK|nr:LysR substrate-binding domain-containing protein [Polynucleobacter antarcticus]QKM62239.1 LysR family transcriptional regulator [Polynucleobacter antarcticus]